MKLPPLSLYIHYPWCIKKCPYCDFNSHTSYQDQDNYIKQLIDDLKNSLLYVQNRKISSIFIGGGTPSLISLQNLDKLFNALNKYLSFVKDIEITIESNPSSSEAIKFKYYRDIGINRLSIGVQSFNDNYLKFLGRLHNADQAINAIKYAQNSGFNNINIDLMFAFSNQTVDDIKNDVQQAINLKPQHISFYQLTIEPNTYFAKYKPNIPNSDYIYDMSMAGHLLLDKYGYKQYEISAYGLPAKHNLNYWQFGDYIGIGAGAHGKITINNKIIRTIKNKSPKDYIASNKERKNTIQNISFEFMLNALRLKNGFNKKLFKARTGKNILEIAKQIKKAKTMDLLIVDNNKIIPTSKGFNYLNNLQELFL